jgi:hypothetical protein
MLSPYILSALGHERHQGLLARAETSRMARQARLHRQQAGGPGVRRSPLRQRLAWPQPRRSRLFGRRPQSAVAGLLRHVRADPDSSAATGGVACGRLRAEEAGE